MKDVLAEAREIYDKTMCGGAGCCGDFDGALEYVDGAVGELIQELVNIQVAGALANKQHIVGLNPLGNVVLFCDLCKETYSKKLQGMTLEEILSLKDAHKCEPTSG